MTSAPRKSFRSSRLLSVVVWVALTSALIVVTRTLPWRSAWEQISEVRAVWLWAAVAANVAILVVWSAEWRLLAPAALRVPYVRVFEVVTAMAAVLNSVPFFAGEATGVALLVERAGLSRGAALSVLAMDQLLSGLSKLMVLGVAALAVPLPSWLRTGILALVVGVAALLGVLTSMAHGWERMHARLIAEPTRLKRLMARVVALGAHLEAMRESGRTWRIVGLGIAKKTAELLAILAVQAAFGLTPSFATGILVLASLCVATIAPIAPANVGVYEAAVFAAYRYMGVAPETALGLALVQHMCFLLPMLTTGYVTLTLRQLVPTQRPT